MPKCAHGYLSACNIQTQLMNCILESVAGIYIGIQQKLFITAVDDPLQKAQEDLEVCKWQLQERADQLQVTTTALCKEALEKRRMGQVQPALQKFQEYKRCQTQLTKVTNGINLLNQQLDILHTNDLDKQIMHSLKRSTTAMRAAGIESVAAEADNVMVDLEDQVKGASNLSDILATPFDVIDESTLERELSAMLQDESMTPQPVVISSMHTMPLPDAELQHISSASNTTPVLAA